MSEPAAAAPAAEALKKENPKDKAKRERMEAKAAEEAAKAAAKAEALKAFADTFGVLSLIQSTTHRTKAITDVENITTAMDGTSITVRARVQNVRGQSKVAFLVLRQTFETIQAVLAVGAGLPQEMIKFAATINPETVVEVQAIVTVPKDPVKSTTKSTVELQVTKLHIVSAAPPVLPFQFEDASRPTGDESAAAAAGSAPTVALELRLNTRWLDLRTRACNALFRLESRMSQYFRDFLIGKDFVEIHTPKIIGTASEGGANVFKMDYFGKPAFLAQSPQLYKQMVLQGDIERVFEIAPVFRAENANTHRHMTEFISMDLEMRINEHYYEVLDVAEELFFHIFTQTAKLCEKELAAVQEQHPFDPIKFQIPMETVQQLKIGIIEDGTPSEDEYGARIRNRDLRMLRIPFPLAIRLYNTQEGVEKLPENEDIGTDAERQLGRLVKERYGVDFYIMDRYPASARPFYTMPDPADPNFSNSYDMFIRGQEIVSGAQRIHDPELLTRNAVLRGVQPDSIKDYIDSFRLGAWPHGGFAIGLERLVFLYLGLSNVRYASMFPRDPKRCSP